MPSTYLITGATGFVGSHLAEACAARGLPIRTLARPNSDTALLERLGATILRGDIMDPETGRQAVAGAEVVVHCAGKVGDWGPVEEFRAANVEGLRNLLEACKDRPNQRFVYLSTLGVYAARHHYGTDESEPLPDGHIDGYTQSKVEAERLALEYHRRHGVPVVVLRPGFVYGTRDRTVMPKLLNNLRLRRVRYLGLRSAGRAMNSIYVGNLVEAIFLAVEKPQAVGQVYNLTDGETVSKRRFIEAVADGAGLPHPLPVRPPLWLARLLSWWWERQARRRGDTEAPPLTQAGIKLLGLNLDFSIAKAKRELGYQPRVPFDQAIRETMAWYRQKA
jgi:nucleoside-diphosphate-sugar epimerase